MIKKSIICICIFLTAVSSSFAIDYKELNSLIKDGAYEEAIQILNKSKDNTFQFHYYYALIYKEQRKYTEARKHIEQALYINKDDIPLNLLLCEVLLEQNDLSLLGQKISELDKKGVQNASLEFIKAKYLSKMGKYNIAIEILNNIQNQPGMEESVLREKSIIYIKQGEIDKATSILNKIMAGPYSDESKDFAFLYLKTISTKREITNISLHYAYGYDNNVVSEPSDKYFASLISGKDSYVHKIGLNLTHDHPLKNGYLSIIYDFSYDAYNHLSRYNYMVNNLGLVVSNAINKNTSLSLEYYIYYSLLDETSYLLINGIYPTVSFITDNKKLMFFLKPFAEKREFIFAPPNKDEDRDSFRYGGKALVSYLCGKNYITFSYLLARDDTEGKNWAANINHFILRFFFTPFEKLTADFSFGYKIDDYLDKHIIFLKQREDKIADGVFTIEYFLDKTFSIFGQYFYVNSNSNITLYDYTRRVTTLGIQARF